MNQFICFLFLFVHSIHVGPSPPNPPVNQTTLADVQLPLTYGPVKSVLRKRTGESSQAQESVCVHDGRTSVEQVTNYNSIGSESSKPSLPKTRML